MPPNHLFNSEGCREHSLTLIDEFSQRLGVQQDIDNSYCDFMNCLKGEMNLCMNFNDKYPGMHETRKRINKPFWNKELQEKWNKTCVAEKKNSDIR